MCKANGFLWQRMKFAWSTQELYNVRTHITKHYIGVFLVEYMSREIRVYHCIILYIIQQWDYSMISHDLFE